MRYFKFRSNPLEEINPAPSSHAVDEYGNLWSFDVMGNKAFAVETMLIDNTKLETAFENPKVALNGFWANMESEIIRVGYVTKF